MRRAASDMSAQELVELFTTIALEQYDAFLDDEYVKYNQLYDQMDDVESALKERAGDQRTELSSLLTHKNPQVRLKSALALLALEPQAALGALQLISDRNEYPQAMEARDMLESIADGSYVPD